MKTRELALTGLMTAVTMVVTRAFIIPIPQTKGFFNLGETAVYMTAVLFGPRAGAIAGGLGSALADLSLGYAAFAPFTLVIKGIEGYVVGTLAQGARSQVPAAGALVGLLLSLWALTIDSWLVRVAAGAIVVAAAASLALLFLPKASRGVGTRVAAMITGGLFMILGYFITQAFIMRLGVPAALVEVPYNMVQVAAGVVAGLLAAATLEEALLVPQR